MIYLASQADIESQPIKVSSLIAESVEQVPLVYTCRSVTWKQGLKIIRLTPGDVTISLPLSGCVAEKDTVIVNDSGVFVKCRNGLSQLLPSYLARDTIQIGGESLEVLVKEIVTTDEHKAYEALADYHYRDAASAGRYARLIIKSHHPLYPTVIGYIELATSFYMNKARSRFMDAPFSDGEIGWDAWKKSAMRTCVHAIVRISRCVVHTEFRGLGIGQILIKHAEAFAKLHWHSGGLRPQFIEIAADMLKYVPFAERAGMTYIGDTEGNLHRVYKDLRYLLQNTERIERGEIIHKDDMGIVREQANRMERAKALMREEGLSQEEFLQLLQNISPDSALKHYARLHDIVRLPKPTYLKGLTPRASDFVAERSKALELSPTVSLRDWSVSTIDRPISIRDITLSYSSKVRRTHQAHAIQQAFNISPDKITSTHIRHLSLEIKPGEVILITGPSGSGKTTLLERLTHPNQTVKELDIVGSIEFPGNYNPGIFESILSRKALIDILDVENVHEALHIMGLVGLSDAYIYLKRFKELSKGQQFRAQLAKLIVSGCNTWIIDEFCSNLDPITAAVVSDKLQRVARQLGVTVVVAAPHASNFVFSLRPDKVLQLTSVWEHRLFAGKAYADAVDKGIAHPKYISFLDVPRSVIFQVLQGRISHVAGVTDYELATGDHIVLNTDDVLLDARILDIQSVPLTKLRREDALRTGFSTRKDLISSLQFRTGRQAIILHLEPSQTFAQGVIYQANN